MIFPEYLSILPLGLGVVCSAGRVSLFCIKHRGKASDAQDINTLLYNVIVELQWARCSGEVGQRIRTLLQFGAGWILNSQ